MASFEYLWMPSYEDDKICAVYYATRISGSMSCNECYREFWF